MKKHYLELRYQPWCVALLTASLSACGGGWLSGRDAAPTSSSGETESPDTPPALAAPSVPQASRPPQPPITTPPVYAMPPGFGTGPFPKGSSGVGRPQVRSTDEAPTGPHEVGAFRLRCEASHFAFDDPIVYPGQAGRAHLHVFFGNTKTSAFSDTATIAKEGNSTCIGGTVNRSAYWVPAMVDMRTNLAVLPSSSDFYYKTGYNGVPPGSVIPFPKELRMIAGDPANRSVNEFGSPYRFACHHNPQINGQSFVRCPVGDAMIMEVYFPQCWDGVHKDSPDHKSHMAYPRGNGCPASHPVALPEVSFHIHYPITQENQQAHWRLSSDTYSGPAGYSAHADWWNGWDEGSLKAWVDGCNRPANDCHSHLLGAGKALY